MTLEASCVSAPVLGDRRLVTILVGNLVDNAIRHNLAGGRATVRTSHSGQRVHRRREQFGPVVDEDEVGHLCEPFMRPGSTRRLHSEGYGLGLAIVRAVADAHHSRRCGSGPGPRAVSRSTSRSHPSASTSSDSAPVVLVSVDVHPPPCPDRGTRRRLDG